MADGNLTWEEFWKLSSEDRLARCGELSDHDAFMVRLTEPIAVISPSCNDCVHYLGYAKCAAYPDGFTGDHIRALLKNPLLECGDGYHFELRQDGWPQR